MPVASIVTLAYNFIYCSLAYIVPGYQTFKVRQARRRSRAKLLGLQRQAPSLS